MSNEIILNSVLNLLLAFVVVGTLALFIWAVADYTAGRKYREIQLLGEPEKFYTTCPKCYWVGIAATPGEGFIAFKAHMETHEKEEAKPAPAKVDARSCEHKTIFTDYQEGPYELQLKYEIAICSLCGTIVNKKERK